MRVLLLYAFCLWVIVNTEFADAEPFKYLQLALQSTAGYCSVHATCVKSQIRDYLTIHGLWPTSEFSSPQNCDPMDKFKPSSVVSIRKDMNRYWPSVAIHKSSENFWSHEWSRHGTCSKELNQLSDQSKYFSKTLALYQRWNLTGYLAQASIVPSHEKTYNGDDLKNALTKRLQHRVTLVCGGLQTSPGSASKPVLTEVRICISKEFRLIDCPNRGDNCPSGPVYYLGPKK